MIDQIYSSIIIIVNSTDMENRLMVAQAHAEAAWGLRGSGEGVGWTGSLGFVDENYYI